MIVASKLAGTHVSYGTHRSLVLNLPTRIVPHKELLKTHVAIIVYQLSGQRFPGNHCRNEPNHALMKTVVESCELAAAEILFARRLVSVLDSTPKRARSSFCSPYYHFW